MKTKQNTNSNQNINLHNAKKHDNDEFYTDLSDIENELKHYNNHFKDKTVYCNCDDPEISNFFQYFSYKFEELGLKKLIITCYKNQNTDLFNRNIPKKATHLECIKNKKNNKIPNIKINKLKGDGDFRSEECIELLKQADIVVTNPPFSLFREYVTQLIEYNKKFLIIGNMNAITYKEIFKLIKEGKIWLGCSIRSGDREFGIPKDYPLTAASSRIDDKGNKFIKVKGVRWFTNLDYKKRHEDLILYRTYNPDEYPKYDNYDAINVDKTKDIPLDYKGAMGVPITFMDKYNPEQFEILGLGNSRDNFTPNKDYLNPYKIMKDGEQKNGNAINCVLAIEYESKPVGIHYISENSKYLIAPYARIIIRHKKRTN